jgi:catechol 2,3-dioxygenase-like lactoylglutathione lyase family enzyme
MATLARLSHVGFNVPRGIFEKECEFWEKVIGLKRIHANDHAVFFTADPLRDHEFIIYAVDSPVTGYGQSGCILNHVALDVATAVEVDELRPTWLGV